MKISKLLSATALAGSLLCAPAVAWGQTVNDSDTTSSAPAAALPQQGKQSDNSDDGTPNTIVVTGSRISRPNLTSTVPVVSISAEELGQTGRVSAGDVLNDLPALQSTFSQANSTRFLGTAGLNLLDLRGLGTQRTLVLVNGRRHVGADILNNAVSVDVNTIPTDLIERVDTVTGGSSAIYGSDAIAGVVNFVLKDHYEGVQLHAQGAISGYGDAGTYYTSVLAGKNFAEGRGNIAVDLEYARQNQTFASQRDYLSRTDGFVTVDRDGSGGAGVNGNIAFNSDGNPDAVFFHDIRVGTFAAGGLVAFGSPNGSCGKDNAGTNFACTYLFQPGGSLVKQTGTHVGLSAGNTSSTPAGAYIGGNGDTRREGQLLQLQPALDRYSANLIAHFDISDAFVPFIEASYVRTDTYGTGSSGPAFFTGNTIDGFYERPSLDNPFLSADARATISAQALALANAGYSPTTGAAFSSPAAQAATIAAINDGSYRFILRKNLTDLGVRAEQAKRETYRFVGGFRGNISSNWNYEFSVNYGEFDEKTKVLGNVNVQRELLALDAVKDTNGNIVCGSQLDPARAYDDFTGNAATLAADIAACKPLNPFGVGSISQEAKDYVLQDTVSVGKITQLVVGGYVAGDTSSFFNLPGGPVYVAAGGEYRRETAFFQEDPLVEAGYTFYNSIAKFDPPAFEVKEAYAEIRLPLLKDLPLIHSLQLTGAARVAGYKGNAGTVWAYNAGADYEPIQGVRFRANYARAVRAPNLVDLYSPQSQNFAPSFSDPCSAINIGNGTQYRAANCAAAGIPASYDYRYAQSLEIVSGGNPDLKSETSDSYTYGVVIEPTFARGFSVSVDYYNIAVNNVITAPSAQGIVNSCYDSPTTDNQFCQLFQRAGAGGGPNGEQQYRIIEGSLQQTLLNYAKLRVRGIDVDMAYTHRVGSDTTLSTHFIYTHALTNSSYLDPTQPGFADTSLGELGSPKDAFNWYVNGEFGQFFLNYQLRYLSKMSVGSIENHEEFQGREPQNLDDYDIPFYPDVVYMDIRAGFNINKGSQFYFGIDNLTNRVPPLGATGIGAGSGIYDAIGRRFYAGITAKF